MTTLRRMTLTAATIAGAAMMGLVSATPAWAHAYITATSPADGAALATPPTQVTLTFDEPVTQVHVAVEGPDGLRWNDGHPVAVDDQVTQQLYPLGPAGTYEINYRVVSVDGHTVHGTVEFDLTAPGPGAPPPQPASTGTSSGGGLLWLVIPIVLGAAAIAGLWYYLGRRRATPRAAGSSRRGAG